MLHIIIHLILLFFIHYAITSSCPKIRSSQFSKLTLESTSLKNMADDEQFSIDSLWNLEF